MKELQYGEAQTRTAALLKLCVISAAQHGKIKDRFYVYVIS